MQATHIVINELSDSSPQLALHATYINSSISMKCFYIMAPIMYNSINYFENQFKTISVFFSVQVHCCTTELKLNVVSSKLILIGI